MSKTNQHIDTIRLNRLSDPKFVFCYSIGADGRVNVTDPCKVTCLNMRQAIDFVRAHNDEQPRCVMCRLSLNESHARKRPGAKAGEAVIRYTCPECHTSFNWKPKPKTP